MHALHRNAFSLVELSIVLVILGLLTGGILTGQSLIRAAELRSVTTEFQRYQAAVLTFRDKYFALPGDMQNATEFWGVMATGTCPNATAGTGTQTCSGNNNGVLEFPASSGQYGEIFGFWQHLANASLIEGTYTGIAGGSGSTHTIAGENAPASKLSNGAWGIYNHGDRTGVADAFRFSIYYGNTFIFGATGSSIPEQVLLSPAEQWGIDKKIDDGKPGTGNLIARFWDTCTDAASSGNATTSHITEAAYALDDDSTLCSIIIRGMLQ